MHRDPSGTTALQAWHVQFVLLALVWGSSFMFIKVAVHDLTPVQVSLGRIALGALALLAVMLATRQRLPRRGPIWGHLAVAALLMNAVPFTLFAVGEQHLPSIMAGIWNATTPLFAVVAGAFVLATGIGGPRVVAGVVLGFAGVVLLLAPWRQPAGDELLAHAALAGAALCYGIGTPYMRRYLSNSGVSPVVLSTVQLAIASLMLALVLPWTGGVPAMEHVGADAAVSVLVLGVLGSGIAYVMYYNIIRAAGATVAATVTYVMPIVSTALGVAVLSEPLSWNLFAGGAIVLAGVLMSARAARR